MPIINHAMVKIVQVVLRYVFQDFAALHLDILLKQTKAIN